MELPGNKCAWQESFGSIHLSGFGNPAIFLGPGILDAWSLETDDCVFFLGYQNTATGFILPTTVFLSQMSGCVLHNWPRTEPSISCCNRY